ncbi:hypothetical protein KQY30_31555 [Streptomyces sp. GMY02]|uniref:hypothetical protein n=1 Tax=Streptomyces sp. GMY02 TaxID=1333528 RepID=UPI001C2C4637|nr:hypothetical protein [Streptomyces sp. GMY02]QXE38091.1 hypothetical protein KQY30_31555 [Streptomyces sp. GMY02]
MSVIASDDVTGDGLGEIMARSTNPDAFTTAHVSSPPAPATASSSPSAPHSDSVRENGLWHNFCDWAL